MRKKAKTAFTMSGKDMRHLKAKDLITTATQGVLATVLCVKNANEDDTERGITWVEFTGELCSQNVSRYLRCTGAAHDWRAVKNFGKAAVVPSPNQGDVKPSANAPPRSEAAPVDGSLAQSDHHQESLETAEEPQLSDEEVLQLLLKEEEQLKNENELYADYLLRVAAAKSTTFPDDASDTATESSDEGTFDHGSRSSVTQSMGTRGSLLEGPRSRRSSSAEYPGLRAPVVSKSSEVVIPETNILARAVMLNAEEKNEIAVQACSWMKEEIENCISDNERILDELMAALDEANLRIGEVRRDRADFQRDVLAEAKAKGPRKDNAGKIRKFMEQKLSKKCAKALKVRERNAALNLQIAKTEQLLANKKELADLLHAVDFEQLQIHKKQNQHRLRDRVHELNRLKSSHAKATEALDEKSYILSSHIRRRYHTLEQLLEREPQLAQVKKDIIKARKKKERLEESFHIFIQERDAQLGEAQPHVLEYMDLRERVHILRKEHRTWSQKVEVAELCAQQPSAHQSEKDAFSAEDMVIGHAALQAKPIDVK